MQVTVAEVKYKSLDKARVGVCSTMISERLQVVGSACGVVVVGMLVRNQRTWARQDYASFERQHVWQKSS